MSVIELFKKYSGCSKISVLSWMNDLSIHFKYILVLTSLSYSIEILL